MEPVEKLDFLLMRNDVSLRLNDVASELANDVVSYGHKHKKKTLPKRKCFLFGAARQTRTADLVLTKDALYHLSHSSMWRPGWGSNPRPLA